MNLTYRHATPDDLPLLVGLIVEDSVVATNDDPADAMHPDYVDALSAIDQADIVVLLVDHRQFSLIDPEALQDKKLVDTRGLWTWRKAKKTDARIEGKKSREAARSARVLEKAA